MDLAAAHELCVNEIQWNSTMLASGYPARSAAAWLEQLSLLFQGLGICHLLEFLDRDKFRENLVRSGHARRYFLRSAKEEGLTDSNYLALSRTEAFLDTLVAGDLKLARSILDLETPQWNRDWEYEEDFCFYLFLFQLFESIPEIELQKTLTRFETALEGGKDARLPVLKALVARDSEAFEAALAMMLADEQRKTDEIRPTIVDSKFLFWPRSFVSIPGLALLRMAELAGMTITAEFPLCPSEARLPVRDNNYRDFFAELAQLAG